MKTPSNIEPEREAVVRMVGDHGMLPLIVRWTFVKIFGYTVRLHLLLRTDDDRALHDHPWWFVSILLSGGYWEHTPQGRFWRRPGSVLFRGAAFSHRIELERPAVSLVICGPRKRDWGFWCPAGWVEWRRFITGNGCGEAGKD